MPGWIAWCPRCEWNLNVPRAPEPRTLVQREYLRAGRRWGERVAERLATADRLEPRWTPSKLAAFAIAVLIHLFTAALVAGGVFALTHVRGNVFAVLGGVVMLGLGWFMRPRLGRVPVDDIVTREQAPELHRLVDDVAALLRTRSADLVVVDHRYNASWSVVGLRRRRVVTLGLPLVNALEPDERLAVIAHEVAHERNGDLTRTFVVGTSVVALNELYAMIAPSEPTATPQRHGATFGGLEAIVANGTLWLLSRPVAWLLALQAHLLWHDSRRAEFLADALAARVAGTAAVIRLHEKTLLAATVEAAAHQVVHHPGDGDVFARARRAVADVPEHERERRRRVARHEHARLDVTHPPTGQRIELLERRPPEAPRLVLDAGRAVAIEAELAGPRAELAQRIVERYRSSLYR